MKPTELTFLTGYAFGLACEKWFVFWGWPDSTWVMAALSTIAGVALLLASVVYSERSA